MQYFSEIYSPVGNMPVLRDTYATTLLEESRDRFNKAKLERESEPLLSSMWKIYRDVEWSFYKLQKFTIINIVYIANTIEYVKRGRRTISKGSK